MTTPESIIVDGVTYVPAPPAPDGDHVLIRSRDAGVFAGVLVSRTGDEVTLSAARRIWKWDGAATLSELAVKGPSKPAGCRFPVSVPLITVLGVCEVIPMTLEAWVAVAAVPTWTAQ